MDRSFFPYNYNKIKSNIIVGPVGRDNMFYWLAHLKTKPTNIVKDV